MQSIYIILAVANHCDKFVARVNPDTMLISGQCIWRYIFIAFLKVIALDEQAVVE